jgi:hypothetical protein
VRKLPFEAKCNDNSELSAIAHKAHKYAASSYRHWYCSNPHNFLKFFPYTDDSWTEMIKHSIDCISKGLSDRSIFLEHRLSRS